MQHGTSFKKEPNNRGHESFEAKVFMRSTVIFSDLVYYAAAFMIRQRFGLIGFCAMIFNPALILIDHGHFQVTGLDYSVGLWKGRIGRDPTLSDPPL